MERLTSVLSADAREAITAHRKDWHLSTHPFFQCADPPLQGEEGRPPTPFPAQKGSFSLMLQCSDTQNTQNTKTSRGPRPHFFMLLGSPNALWPIQEHALNVPPAPSQGAQESRRSARPGWP